MIHWPEKKNSNVQNACEKDTRFYQPSVVPHGDIFVVSDLSISFWFSNEQRVRLVLTTYKNHQ